MGRAAGPVRFEDILKWNTVPPTVPGYYWIAEGGEIPHIVQVDAGLDPRNKFEVLLPGDDKRYPPEMWAGALWCGPLQSPE